MRIALLTHQWPGVRLGGIGAYTRYASIALTRAGHDVHVLTLKLPADAFQSLPEGVSVNQIAGPVAAAGGEVTYRLALAQAFHDELITIHARHPFDIIEGPEYEALAIALAGKNVPVVTQLHSGSAIARDVGNLPADAEQAMR